MKTDNLATLILFPELTTQNRIKREDTTEKLTRLDIDDSLKEKLLPFCRLKYGEVWEDPIKGHKVGVLDATRSEDIKKIMVNKRTKLIVNDPPYNVVVGNNNTEILREANLNVYNSRFFYDN